MILGPCKEISSRRAQHFHRHQVGRGLAVDLEAQLELAQVEALEREVDARRQEVLAAAQKQAAELVRLVRRFEGAGIRVLPLKGSVLAVQAYEKLELRHAVDLDLLMAEEDLEMLEDLEFFAWLESEDFAGTDGAAG